MKPARFVYHAPSSLGEALALLDQLRDEDAKVLAGGQSLMPLLNMRLARPRHLVDINGVGELAYIRAAEDGGLAIGALTRQQTIERSPEVARGAPLLAEVMPLIGDRQIRGRGTIGGSFAHADPVAEIPTVAAALDAELVIGNLDDTRVVLAMEFPVSFLTTVLEPAELLLEVRLPPTPPGAGFAFLELARQQGAFAIVSAAAMLTLQNGRIGEARICLGGVAPTPIRASRAEALLRGAHPSADAFAEAARLAGEDTDPSADVHGSEAYRREMAEVYTRRALHTALSRAREGPHPPAPSPNAGRGRSLTPSPALPHQGGGGTGPHPNPLPEGEDARPLAVRLRVNGVPYERLVEPRKLLSDFIRQDLGLTGTHVGCEHGVCGACTVVANGEAVKSCLMLAVQARMADVLTVEGLAVQGRLHPIQQAFHEHHGLQCGFCTPGMLLSALTLLTENPDPTEEQIKAEMDGNLCRCTGYYNIIAAIQAAAGMMKRGDDIQSVSSPSGG